MYVQVEIYYIFYNLRTTVINNIYDQNVSIHLPNIAQKYNLRDLMVTDHVEFYTNASDVSYFGRR